jgi:hypothetical protein
MAKLIKYQLVTKIPHEVVVQVPLLDENGEPVMKEIATPVTEEVTVPVLNELGEPVLDENGEPITKVVAQPVYDENGEPVVEITYEPVMVDEIKEEVEIILTPASISCKTQESFDKNLPIVLAEAYNEEYTVEGEFDYVTAPYNILAGEYVTIQNVLYLAIENIPNGEPIIVGQNAIQTTVEEQLYAMKGE